LKLSPVCDSGGTRGRQAVDLRDILMSPRGVKVV